MRNLDLKFNSLVVVDMNNLMHRNYHSHPFLTSQDGLPTGALYGTIKMLKSFLEEEMPMVLVCCFDYGKRNFRHDIYPDYKGNRGATDAELVEQFKYIKTFLTLANIQYVELENFEGDDVMGSIVTQAKSNGYSPYILSGDQDLLQLVDEQISMIYLSTKDGTVMYDLDGVKEKYNGLYGPLLVELKGLQGDTSDSIPGVKGIGPKTGIQMINDFGSLEGVYENIDSIKGKKKDYLISDRENAFMSRTLGKIKTDLTFKIQDNLEPSFTNGGVTYFLERFNIKDI